jgi:hypothetical protein
MQAYEFDWGDGAGQPEIRCTTPPRSTRRACSLLAVSHSIADSPITMAAVAAMLASTHVPATTLDVRHGPAAGKPVAGSMM